MIPPSYWQQGMYLQFLPPWLDLVLAIYTEQQNTFILVPEQGRGSERELQIL
jgi:hypothetical protein